MIAAGQRHRLRFPTSAALALLATAASAGGAAFAAAASAMAEPAQAPGESVVRAYYLDTGCEACAPRQGDREGSYWILTADVCSAAPDDFEAIAEEFRSLLRERYAGADDLVDTVVLRYRDTAAEAEAGRTAKAAKMTESGYSVLTVDFRCASDAAGDDAASS